MIAMPYATVTAALVAAAALAAVSVRALNAAQAEPRVPVLRTQRWLSRLSHPSIPGLSIVDSWLGALALRLALGINRVRVRRALLRTEALLRAVRRHHRGAHRLDLSTRPVRRRFAGRDAGWLPRIAPVRASAARSEMLAPVTVPVAVATAVGPPVIAGIEPVTLPFEVTLVATADEPVSPAPLPSPEVLSPLDVLLEVEAEWPDELTVIESSTASYRPIRTHRPSRTRRPTAQPGSAPTRPRAPRSRDPRPSRLLENAW